MIITDQTRDALAREIHDELGSILTAANLELATLKLKLKDSKYDDAFGRLSDLIHRGMTFSRRVVERLHDPTDEYNRDLTAAIHALAATFNNDELKIKIHIDNVLLTPAAIHTAYRVIQEALNNVVKYAQAANVRITMLDCGYAVVMSIRDDGRGFDTDVLRVGGNGLHGMKERVRQNGGNFIVTSSDAGTLVLAVIPKNLHAQVQTNPNP